jgi:hypothetical protein
LLAEKNAVFHSHAILKIEQEPREKCLFDGVLERKGIIQFAKITLVGKKVCSNFYWQRAVFHEEVALAKR